MKQRTIIITSLAFHEDFTEVRYLFNSPGNNKIGKR